MSGDCFKFYKEVFDDNSEPTDAGEDGEEVINITVELDDLFAIAIAARKDAQRIS